MCHSKYQSVHQYINQLKIPVICQNNRHRLSKNWTGEGEKACFPLHLIPGEAENTVSFFLSLFCKNSGRMKPSFLFRCVFILHICLGVGSVRGYANLPQESPIQNIAGRFQPGKSAAEALRMADRMYRAGQNFHSDSLLQKALHYYERQKPCPELTRLYFYTGLFYEQRNQPAEPMSPSFPTACFLLPLPGRFSPYNKQWGKRQLRTCNGKPVIRSFCNSLTNGMPPHGDGARHVLCSPLYCLLLPEFRITGHFTANASCSKASFSLNACNGRKRN